MSFPRRYLALGGAALALLLTIPAAATAATPGQPICTAAGSHETPVVVPDGVGGGYVAWTDSRSGTSRIYLQHVEAQACAPAWAPDGLAAEAADGWMAMPGAVTDGAGGCIVVWRISSTAVPGLYAQRFDPAGVPLWTVGGQPVSTVTANQTSPDVASDGQGGVIIAWEDRRYAGVPTIFAQRLDAAGTPLWTAGGVELAPLRQGTVQQTPRVLADGFGGAMVAWSGDPAGGDFNIYVQRITGDGLRLFSTFGQGICTVAGNQTNPRLDHDGWNQIVVVWGDDRSGGLETYANNIDWGANRWWSDGGVSLGAANTDCPQVMGDGSGGAIVAWPGPAPDYRLLVRRLSPVGVTMWTTDVGGPVVDRYAGAPVGLRIVPDGAGGGFVAWEDYDSDGGYGIRAQRLDAAGATVWPGEGVVLRQAQGGYFEGVRLAADGAGGALAVWQELIAAGIWHVYGQGVAADGSLSLPAPAIAAVRDVPRDQGGKLQVLWDRSSWDRAPFERITHYSVWRRFGAADAQAKRAEPWEWLAAVPAIHAERYAATVPSLADSQGVDPGWQTFRVVSHTVAATEFYPSARDSGYSVDNLSPAIPTGLQAAPRPGGGLDLAWVPVDDPDLERYEVHRGVGAGFPPSAATLVAATTAPAAADPDWHPGAGCWYKVAALDVHGNSGGYAVLDPGGSADGGTPGLPERFFLTDARPNPFNPSTRIAFGLDTPADVRLSVHDAAGRLVRVLVDRRLTPGRYEAEWRGDDGAGRAMPSGVYLCRITAGPRSETRKLTLLR